MPSLFDLNNKAGVIKAVRKGLQDYQEGIKSFWNKWVVEDANIKQLNTWLTNYQASTDAQWPEAACNYLLMLLRIDAEITKRQKRVGEQFKLTNPEKLCLTLLKGFCASSVFTCYPSLKKIYAILEAKAKSAVERPNLADWAVVVSTDITISAVDRGLDNIFLARITGSGPEKTTRQAILNAPENYIAIFKSGNYAEQVSKGLVIRARYLPSENAYFKVIVRAKQKANAIAAALANFQLKGLLSLQRAEQLLKYGDSYYYYLDLLNQRRLLTPANETAFTKNKESFLLFTCMIKGFKQQGKNYLVSADNIQAVLTNIDFLASRHMYEMFSYYKAATYVSTSVVRYEDSPEKFFPWDQQTFDEIIAVARTVTPANIEQVSLMLVNKFHPDMSKALAAARRLRPPSPIRTRSINPAQSTHTASVHKSASDIASYLSKLYNSQLEADGLDSVLKEINDWLNAVNTEGGFEYNGKDSKLKLGAAKRLFSKVKTNEKMKYEDPASKVTTLKLLALSWIALHNTRKVAAQIGPKKHYIQCLYEIQRGYNIKNDTDNGLADSPICTSGSFNKVAAILSGDMHQGVEIKYMTFATAGLKFPALVKAAAREHLSSQLGKLAEGDKQAATSLCDNFDIESIWEDIKPNVVSAFISEFGTLFGKNYESHPKYKGITENYTYIDFTTVIDKLKAEFGITADDSSAPQPSSSSIRP